MNRLVAFGLAASLGLATAPDAFGWGAVTGPAGGAAYRGPAGAAAVRAPYGGAVYVRGVRPWVRAPYYGAVVAGVTMGVIIATTAVPPAPAPQLCWFWSSPAQNQGYWDYCY